MKMGGCKIESNAALAGTRPQCAESECLARANQYDVTLEKAMRIGTDLPGAIPFTTYSSGAGQFVATAPAAHSIPKTCESVMYEIMMQVGQN